MSTVNGRIIFKEPAKIIVPGKHLVYLEEKIDLENVSLQGGVLARQLILSPDPYMLSRFLPGGAGKIGQPPVGFGISVVIRSDDEEFKEGNVVYGATISWEHYSVYRAEQLQVLKAEEGIPLSAYVGILGMPGQTAYLSLKEIADLKKGETIFVSAASGAVGSVAAQLAKRAGLKVIGSAGREDKVAFLKDELGVDVAFNYKTDDTAAILEKEGPVDVYFDNVGGETFDIALAYANRGGRFPICGGISKYGRNGDPYAVKNTGNIQAKELTVRGFTVTTLLAKYGKEEFFKELSPLVKSGELVNKEWKTEGLENAAQALADFLTGANFGKAIVNVSKL